MSPIDEISAILSGIFLVLGMHFIALVLLGVFAGILYQVPYGIGNFFVFLWFYAVVGISIFQLLYVVPVVILLRRRQNWGLMKGVIIGAVLTVLLNGSCWVNFLNHPGL